MTGGKLYTQLIKIIETKNKRNLSIKFVNSQEAKEIIDLIEKQYGLTENNILGLGTSCVVFELYDEKGKGDVIKVCSKKISFFQSTGDHSGHDLKKIVTPLEKYLLPMKEIIYDGNSFFVYRQEKCLPLTSVTVINPDDFLSILDIIQNLILNGLLVGQLKPKNLGYSGRDNDQLVLFDYHSMHHLPRHFRHADWADSLVDSLKFYCYLFAHAEKKNFVDSTRPGSSRRLRKAVERTKKQDQKLPKPFKNFFKYVKTTQGINIEVLKLISLLEECKNYVNSKNKNNIKQKYEKNDAISKKEQIFTNILNINYSAQPNQDFQSIEFEEKSNQIEKNQPIKEEIISSGPQSFDQLLCYLGQNTENSQAVNWLVD